MSIMKVSFIYKMISYVTKIINRDKNSFFLISIFNNKITNSNVHKSNRNNMKLFNERFVIKTRLRLRFSSTKGRFQLSGFVRVFLRLTL